MKDFQGETLSLAFECQTEQRVPVEDHDIPVEKIFTEKGIIFVRKGEDNE